uniref:ABC1 atypical kinase-like domain-containing protein n=1 Tax=viral metagenome TaxID=1070528 RepID=A0A6C0IB01_9ZZZZ
MNNRKLKIWDFSSRFLLRKKIIDSFYKGYNYAHEQKKLGVWTRNYLTELGPTFIKLGQTFSTRTDLFPTEFIEELEYLQDSVTEIPPTDLENTLIGELKEPVDSIFSYFDYQPYKSASLGQVHKGILKSGKKVAVKIQRPGVKKLVTYDIAVLLEILSFFDIIGYSTGPSAKQIFLEAKNKLFDELNYLIEANNAIRFRNNFKNTNWVVVPRVYTSKSTEKLLIMEWVHSFKINDLTLQQNGISSLKISKMLIDFFVIQTMKHGFFHADPHPGNIGVNLDGNLVVYDFGLVIELPKDIQTKTKDIIMCIIQRDTTQLVDIFLSLGIIIEGSSTKYEIALFFDSLINYLEKAQNIPNSELKNEVLLKLSQEKPFNIPSSFIFLGKSLGIIEGICNQLDPNFNFVEYLSPYFEETVMDSIDIQKMASSTLEIPSKINYISTSISNLEQQKTEFDIKLKKYQNNVQMNNYLVISLLTVSNFTGAEIGSELVTMTIIILYLIFQRKNRR